MSELPFSEVARQLNENIALLAHELLGEPNQLLSTRHQFRFGSRGSIAVEIAGSKRGNWFDHENSVGGDGIELICRVKDADRREALEFGRNWLDLDPAKPNGKVRASNGATVRSGFIKSYDYRDETGKILFQVCRFDPKDFRQRRPDTKGGWIWKTSGVRKVLYRLPELIAAPIDQWVFIVEGEKDADNLVRLGLVATTNPGGAANAVPGKPTKPKWLPEYNTFFRNRRACIVPDNDDCGRVHAISIARNLTPLTADLRIAELAGIPEKGDVSDWLAADGTAEKLVRIAESAPTFEEQKDCRVNCTDLGDALETALSGTEDEVALEFSRRHASELRYVQSMAPMASVGRRCLEAR
jgi:putative DNA primase/helicase